VPQVDLFDQGYNAVLAAADYAAFAAALRAYDCRRCSLCRARSKIVLDRGNPHAPILIVSERPGANEDATGQAFVGRAGELLDKIMAAIGLDTNRDMLITNVVKCMPETDRAPSSEEARTCRPFLERQIELVKPKVVLLLGAVALKWMDPDHGEISMEREAGRFFTLAGYPGIQFMVLYHPAFLLRDPRRKRDMWEHVKQLREFLGEPRGERGGEPGTPGERDAPNGPGAPRVPRPVR
jgi:uracil-DNA glycosylase family 4